jgi:hypothetical protein
MDDSTTLPPRLLSVRSVARELDCSTSKVYALIAKEEEKPGTGLRSIRIDPDPVKEYPGMLRVRREDLEELLVRWGMKSTDSESIETSGVLSSGTGAISSETRSALRRQKVLGRLPVLAKS